MSRSLAKSGKAVAIKSLKEKWEKSVQSTKVNGEKEIGGSSTITLYVCLFANKHVGMLSCLEFNSLSQIGSHYICRTKVGCCYVVCVIKSLAAHTQV